GCPRPFQPTMGNVVDRPWLSETSVTERLPPARVGSPEPPIAGIGKSVVGFATILGSFASLMMVILPGIRLSAAHKRCAGMSRGARSQTEAASLTNGFIDPSARVSRSLGLPPPEAGHA